MNVKRETGVAWYFWMLIVMALLHAWIGKTVEGAVFLSSAGIVATLNLIARKYFDEE